MESSPETTRTALRPFASLIWAALFLLLIELALEVRAINRGFHGVLLQPKAGRTAIRVIQAQEYGPSLDFPFRSRVFDPSSANGATPLWLASSSYGEDVFVPVEQIFATRLAQRLEKPVINASRSGKVISSNLRELKRYGPTYEPGFVLLYQMSNDIDLISERLAAGLAPDTIQNAEAAPDHFFKGVAPWIQKMTTYRQLKSQITPRLAEHLPLWSRLEDHVPKGMATPQETFREAVVAFIEGVKHLGAEPILITFATAYGPSELDQVPPWISRQNLSMNVVLSTEGWLHSIQSFNKVLREIAIEKELVCIDLDKQLHGVPELFRDLWHLTPKGHARVAEILAQELTAAYPQLAP